MDIVMLRDELRRLGYNAYIANLDIEIDQGSRLHLLSNDEAMALCDTALSHPVDLLTYSETRGHSRWYTFQ